MNQKGTILIVDDLVAVREVLNGLLTGQGYNLVFADNGPNALATAREIMPDLILLDVMMPDMDGFEVCRHLRADELLAEVPVVMVTALDDHDSLLRGIEVGADDFLSKPFNHAELRARVGTIIRLNRYRRLLAARTKFDWVVEQTKDGYLVIDDQDTILYANPQARLYLGLPADSDDLSAATFLDLATKQYSLEPQTAWETWPEPAGVPSPRYLVQPETLTAQAFWLQVETLALPPGSGEGRVIHLSDVTLQVTLQRDIWEFQAMVAHKLRTPTTSIYSGLHLMEEEDTSAWDAGTVKLFDIIRRGADRLYHEVEDILDYLQTPDLAGPGAGFNLAALQPLAHQLSLDLKLEPISVCTAADLNEVYLALHPQAVELVLWEIFENSRKFHPQKSPKIEISVNPLAENKSVSLQIKDDGVHLSPEQLGQVWTPFYQADKYLTGEIEGMGLGLSKIGMLLWNAGSTCRIYNRSDTTGVVVELILPVVTGG